MEISLSPFFAKLVLSIIPYRLSHRVLIVCLGYNEDYDNFTELVWKDDRKLDFYDKQTYSKFQLWIQARIKGTSGINPRTKERRPITRAFYARTGLVKKIFEIAS